MRKVCKKKMEIEKNALNKNKTETDKKYNAYEHANI